MNGWRNKIGRTLVPSLLLLLVAILTRCSLLLGDLSIPGEVTTDGMLDGGADLYAPAIVHVTDLRAPEDLHVSRDAGRDAADASGMDLGGDGGKDGM